MADQLERNAASRESAESSSHSQQFRQPEKEKPEESYNSADQRKIYHYTQQSYNEQREQYTEQAFDTSKDEKDGKAGTGGQDMAPASLPQPEGQFPDQETDIPASKKATDPPAAYDSALDRLTQKRDAAAQKVDDLYHSIKKKDVDKSFSSKARKGTRLIPKGITEHEAAHRLISEKKAKSVKVAAYSRDSHNRLGFSGMEKRITQKEHDRRARKKYRKKYVKDFVMGRAVRTGRLLFDKESIPDDDDAAGMKRMVKKGARTGRLIIRKSIQGIDRETNKYARLKTAVEKEKLLNEKIKHMSDKKTYLQERAAAKAEYKQERASLKTEGKSMWEEPKAGRLSDSKRRQRFGQEVYGSNKEQWAEKLANAKAVQKKKLKQAQIRRKEREGNFFRRTWNSIKIKKKTVEQKAKKTKSILSVAVSFLLIFVVLLFSNLFIYIFGMVIFQGTTESYTQTIVQVDYGVMSECTAYYRKLETDLTEKLADTVTLEAQIREEYGDDIYEYVYELAGIGFDSTTLVAYLGAKYVEFTLEEVQAELEELFSLNYILSIETKMEYRETADAEVKICYIRLEKTPLEEIVTGRMTEEQLRQYEVYKMSSGGQQVYGPVMETDWTNLITSNFGERIHPITKERTNHKGVDIGIPIGTPLYSAVDGTVTVAQYSETAGNFIRIQNDTGWTVTFMHMDSISVTAGMKVKKGDFVGYSGNTGRSTGPHLHLEVWDADGKPVNPVFIIPQNCVMITD